MHTYFVMHKDKILKFRNYCRVKVWNPGELDII